MVSRDANLTRGHQIAKLMHFGLDAYAAAELTVSLEERPTSDQVRLWITQSEFKLTWRFLALLVPYLGALIAILWKVFGS